MGQGLTFRTPRELREEFLTGWVVAASDIRIVDPHYLDAGQTAVCTFTVVGTELRLMPQPSGA